MGAADEHEGYELPLRMTVTGERLVVTAERLARATEDQNRKIGDFTAVTDARYERIERFIESVEGRTTWPQLLSDFATHALGQRVLAAAGTALVALLSLASLWATGVINVPALDSPPVHEDPPASVELP